MAAKIKRCARCSRRMRGQRAEWACSIDIDDEGLGTVTEFYCPDCTTAEEHTQRAINDATTSYVWHGGRVARYPKLPNFQPAALN
jgi:hypothetical protein